MRAAALLLSCVLVTAARADGMFCWDPVNEAGSYLMYWTEVGTVGEEAVDPETGLHEIRTVTAPPEWSDGGRLVFGAPCCDLAECCVWVVEPPGDLVYYYVVADRAPADALLIAREGALP